MVERRRNNTEKLSHFIPYLGCAAESKHLAPAFGFCPFFTPKIELKTQICVCIFFCPSNYISSSEECCSAPTCALKKLYTFSTAELFFEFRGRWILMFIHSLMRGKSKQKTMEKLSFCFPSPLIIIQTRGLESFVWQQWTQPNGPRAWRQRLRAIQSSEKSFPRFHFGCSFFFTFYSRSTHSFDLHHAPTIAAEQMKTFWGEK